MITRYMLFLESFAAMITPDSAPHPAFEILEPQHWRAPIIFNSPHSGADYPPEFLDEARLGLSALRLSEDSFVDEMIRSLPERGFPIVWVNFPRSYVDVNREPFELDPRMFAGRLPSFVNSRSMRVAGGLGTIPRIAGDGQEIYRHRLNVDTALARIESLYKPYHRALRRLMRKAQDQFGVAILVDCHSMPSTGLSREEPARPDVVIGDRYGISCTPLLSRIVEETLAQRGYSTTRNKPYAGGFITEHYGHPEAGKHTIQIEINRSIYMDEQTRARGSGLARLAADFAILADALAHIPLDRFKPGQQSFSAAAE